MPQIRTLMKQGGSTVVSIPPYMLSHLMVSAGDSVQITLNHMGSVIIEPIPEPDVLPLSRSADPPPQRD